MKAIENRLHLLPLTISDAEIIAAWRYEEPYGLYNVDGDTRAHARRLIRDDRSRCYAIYCDDKLTGFCSFGLDGQVPGGPYDSAATDIGMSIRPDLTGQGRGKIFAKRVCDFAFRELHSEILRVTVAGFNTRALHVWQNAGFTPIGRFSRSDGVEFVVMQKDPM